MSLNRHNPFVASLATLVEPAPGTPVPAVPTAHVGDAQHRTLLERFESLAAFGQTLGAEPDASAGTLPEEAAIEAQTYRLYPYYY
jgi:hypothetical protein